MGLVEALALSLVYRGRPSALDLSHLPLVRSFRLQARYERLGPVRPPPANDAFLLNLTTLLTIRDMAMSSIFEFLPSCTGLRRVNGGAM